MTIDQPPSSGPTGDEPSQRLFSYGTLQLEAVQLATFGRRLAGARDELPAYRADAVEIDDPATVALSGTRSHTIARYTGRSEDAIAGTVFAITGDELAHADRYEVPAYRRVTVTLRSGLHAWVYVDATSSHE